MATENRNPKGLGNAKGQRTSRQQGAGGTVDQASDPDRLRRTQHAAEGLRQGTVDTEEPEG